MTFVPLVLAFHPISLDQNLQMIPRRINLFLLTKCHMSSKLGPLSPDAFLSMKVHINVLLAGLLSRTLLGSLQRSHSSASWINGSCFYGMEGEGDVGRERSDLVTPVKIHYNMLCVDTVLTVTKVDKHMNCKNNLRI